MKITGTFLDEVGYDIPHQNWGKEEWRNDFRYMKAIGIDTVILTRCGYKKFLAYPSSYLTRQQGCYVPPVDMLKLFLELAEEFNMQFWFGLYDSGFPLLENIQQEIDINRFVIDEVWRQYGHYKSFKGWYLGLEVNGRASDITDVFATLGKQCKAVSNTLPTLISPRIDGEKAIMATSPLITSEQAVSLQAHELEWNEIFDGIKDAISVVAFRDGQTDYHELEDFLSINKMLASKHNLQCWINVASYDKDMPIKFLPIQFEKMQMKLDAARKAEYDKAVTFEFSHFMSPQSAYLQAGHLYNRYKEHYSI